MQNDLCRIGMLVYDLKRQVTFGQGKSAFDFLETEFKRISVSLAWKWNDKINGFPYLLEFHRREAVFLMDELSRLDQYNTDLKGLNANSDFLCEIYTSLMLGLSELIDCISLMQQSSALLDQSTLTYN